MKKLILIFFAFLTGLSSVVYAQCPAGDLYFLTQAEINNFKVNYPSCTQIPGNIYVKGTDIKNLAGFSNLVSIGGWVYIGENPGLTDINGLSALKSIGSNLTIGANERLSNINGLAALETIGGHFILSGNYALTSISGLASLKSVGGDFSLSSSPALTSSNGLSSLTSVGRNLSIELNNSLTEINGLANLTSTGGDVTIGSNNNLTNFSGLSALTSIGGGLSIKSNHALQNLNGLSSLTSITKGLEIYNNGLLTSISGLSGIAKLGGSLRISNNGNLTNLTGLSSLKSIGGWLEIWSNNNLANVLGLSALESVDNQFSIAFNSSLTNLNGLSSLTKIRGLLQISGNPTLTSISGLSNIDPTTITDLTITSNSLLSVCNLSNFCSYLATTKPRSIYGNAANCISEAVLTTICFPCRTPAGAAATTVTALTGTFTWNTVSNASKYDWVVVADNADPATATPVASGTVTGTTATATGLGAKTSYDFYVRADCMTEGKSTWSAKLDFTTLDVCPDIYLYFATQAEINRFKVDYPACTNFANSIQITGSDITNLQGLANLTKIEGSLNINNNTSLTNLGGLSSLTNIGGQLSIDYNSSLTSVSALSSLISTGGALSISSNSQLVNLSGFSSLKNIGGGLSLNSNASLTNVDGLNSLIGIAGGVNIWGNTKLNSIVGISNIDAETITNLTIVSNPLLSVCHLPNFCKFLAKSSDTHWRFISSNLASCISEATIIAACNPCSAAVTLASPGDDYSSETHTLQAKAVSGKISATNKITNTARVSYEAASVSLLPGFQAQAQNGAVFKAIVGGCD